MTELILSLDSGSILRYHYLYTTYKGTCKCVSEGSYPRIKNIIIKKGATNRVYQQIEDVVQVIFSEAAEIADTWGFLRNRWQSWVKVI